MQKIKAKIVRARQICLHAEVRTLQSSELHSSKDFERIGRILDKILRYIQENEIGELRQK